MATTQSGKRGATASSRRTSKTTSSSQPQRDRPWLELRSGMLKAVIWENQDSRGNSYFSTVLARIYQDGEDNWQETTSLGRDDLLKASNLLRRAFARIEHEEQRRRDEEKEAAA